MDWYPLYNSVRIALISTVIIFFAGIAAAYYVARGCRAVKRACSMRCSRCRSCCRPRS